MNTKNKMKIFLSIALIAFVMIGCSKDDDDNNDDNNNNNPPASGLTAKIDGTAWTSSMNTVTIKDGMTTISGFTAKSTILTINIVSESTGTYQLDNTSAHTAMLVDDTGNYNSVSDSLAGGEVIISDINTADSTISGTYHFDLYDFFSGEKKSVTEGSFTKLKFTGDNGGGGAGDGTMQLDVDGNTWTPDVVTAASALGLIALSGEKSDSEQTISFLLPNDITTGTYDLATGEITAIYIAENELAYFASTGTFEVTTHNTTTNKFEGTFNFEGSDFGTGTVSITNGSFDVTYLEAKK